MNMDLGSNYIYHHQAPQPKPERRVGTLSPQLDIFAYIWWPLSLFEISADLDAVSKCIPQEREGDVFQWQQMGRCWIGGSEERRGREVGLDWPANYENAEPYGLGGKEGERRGVGARAGDGEFASCGPEMLFGYVFWHGGTDWMINS